MQLCTGAVLALTTLVAAAAAACDCNFTRFERHLRQLEDDSESQEERIHGFLISLRRIASGMPQFAAKLHNCVQTWSSAQLTACSSSCCPSRMLDTLQSVNKQLKYNARQGVLREMQSLYEAAYTVRRVFYSYEDYISWVVQERSQPDEFKYKFQRENVAPLAEGRLFNISSSADLGRRFNCSTGLLLPIIASVHSSAVQYVMMEQLYNTGRPINALLLRKFSALSRSLEAQLRSCRGRRRNVTATELQRLRDEFRRTATAGTAVTAALMAAIAGLLLLLLLPTRAKKRKVELSSEQPTAGCGRYMTTVI